jgi:leucyl aminopeptidase (aminopeptidase T)
VKLILFVLWAALTFSPTAEAEEPKVFKAVVSIQVLCTLGGPEELMKKLLDSYNEKPVHAMNISTPSGLNIQMYITENRNNPSSTVLLHNHNVNKTCIFWTAKDYIRTIETESLPAKSPKGKTGA